MCGIGGMNLNDRDAKTLDVHRLARCLAFDLEVRGYDATGCVWADPDGIWYDKAPVQARHYVNRMPITPGTTNAVIHTRWATGGDAASPEDNNNNHPFALPGVTGVHNGVIDNVADLYDLAGAEPTTGTDSEAVFAALAYREGMTRREVLELVEGAASVAWVESTHPRRTYLARLSGRPLAIGHTPRGSMVWASTPVILRSACRSAGVEIREVRMVPEWTYLVLDSGNVRRWDRMTPHVVISPSRKLTVARPGTDLRDALPKGVRLGW